MEASPRILIQESRNSYGTKENPIHLNHVKSKRGKPAKLEHLSTTTFHVQYCRAPYLETFNQFYKNTFR